MKKIHLFAIRHIGVVALLLGLTVTACNKTPQVKESTGVTNTMMVSNTAATSVVPSANVMIGSGVSTTQTLVLNQSVKSVLADVSATFIYDPSVGDKIAGFDDQS